jgi:hypothetical protein
VSRLSRLEHKLLCADKILKHGDVDYCYHYELTRRLGRLGICTNYLVPASLSWNKHLLPFWKIPSCIEIITMISFALYLFIHNRYCVPCYSLDVSYTSKTRLKPRKRRTERSRPPLLVRTQLNRRRIQVSAIWYVIKRSLSFVIRIPSLGLFHLMFQTNVPLELFWSKKPPAHSSLLNGIWINEFGKFGKSGLIFKS